MQSFPPMNMIVPLRCAAQRGYGAFVVQSFCAATYPTRADHAACAKIGTALALDPNHALLFFRDAVAPGQLVPGLETEGAHVKVNRKMETSIPGVFACGDITGTPYQYVKAAGEGNIAAISAAAYIDQKKRTEGGQENG